MNNITRDVRVSTGQAVGIMGSIELIWQTSSLWIIPQITTTRYYERSSIQIRKS